MRFVKLYVHVDMFELFVHYETMYKAESITTNLPVDSQLTESFVIMKVGCKIFTAL